ncbi:TonB-dependent receptor [Hyphomonas sp.]|uniref:TonB-dependent receptor n=1 Tax=Hyphomonas sp. TaxID=87 RepID=UPI0035271F38
MKKVLSSAVCTAALFAPFGLAHAEDADAGEGTRKLDPVVVTAQMREQSAIEVPLALTALTADQLQDRQINDVVDLAKVTPGLSVATFSTAPKITLRGIGNEAYNYGGDGSIAFHADGVYIGRAEPQRAAFFDVARVEVLRGPQGTLYGRNTTGGAINVVYQHPTDTFSSELSAGIGNYGAYDVSAIVNGPMGDGVAGRLSMRREYNEGMTDNVMPGRKDLDDQDNYQARAQIQFNPSDTFELLLQGEFYRNQRRGPGRKFLGGPEGAVTPAEAPPYNGQWLTTLNSRDVVSTYDPKEDMDFWSLSAQAKWDLDGVQLQSISSYRDHVFGNANDEGDGLDVDFSTLNIQNDIHQFSQEFRLLSDSDGQLSWILGAYYFLEDGDFGRQIPFFVPNIVLMNGGSVRTDAVAAYGHLDFEATDRLTLSAGLRYGQDKKEMTEFLSFIGIPFAGTNALDDSWSATTWDVGAEFGLTEDSFLFARIARGFKSGGFNTGALEPSSFDPEYVTSYEAGLRGEFFDKRATMSLVGYYSDYEDMQLVKVQDFATVFSNAASSEIKGIEFEGRFSVTEAFTIDVMAAYTDAKLNEFTTIDSALPALGEQNLAGNTLPHAPEWQAAIAGQYVIPLGNEGEVSINGNYSWRDKVYFDAFNREQRSQDAVGKVDASISYTSPSGAWELTLWGKNLTDELVLGHVSVLTDAIGSPHMGFWEPPRTYGLRVTRNFN